MDIDRLIMIVFAVAGVIFAAVVLWYLFKRVVEAPSDKKEWPPSGIMQLEAQCPSYWTIDGYQGNQVYCRNKFNLPVQQSMRDECKNVTCPKDRVSFPRISKWPLNRNDDHIRARCKWRNCCGLDDKTPAPWIGVDGYC